MFRRPRVGLVVLSVWLCFTLTEARAVASTPLFQQSHAESFNLTDTKTNKAPQVIVLNDDEMQISLAALVGKALQFPTDEKGLTLRLERLTFTPFNDKKNITAPTDRLHLRARVSGRDFDLEPAVSKADLVSGKLLKIKFPEETNDASVATIISSGELQLRYNDTSDTLEIPHGEGAVSYDSKLGLNGKRHLTFSAKGKHVAN